MRNFLLKEKHFNPNAVDLVVRNFIDSATLAKIPCTTKKGIVAAYEVWSDDYVHTCG